MHSTDYLKSIMQAQHREYLVDWFQVKMSSGSSALLERDASLDEEEPSYLV